MHFPLATSTWDHREIDALNRVISSRQFTMGAEVSNFEEDFSRKFDSSYSIMSNSGSSANLLALAALRYSSKRPQPGRDEVIVPAVSWSTTYFPIVQMGFRLKFVDIDLKTLNSSLESIERVIDSKTAGIVAVNLLGNPSPLAELRELVDEHGIFLVEDNCESMGAKYKDKFAGTWGDIGTFSTFFSHHISTMEGGVSTTNSEELYQVMMSLRAHGWTRGLPETNYVLNKTGDAFQDSFMFALPGYNLRPLELEGAVGREQLLKLDSIVDGRRANAKRFLQILEMFPTIQVQEETEHSSWFGFSMVLSGQHTNRRPQFVETLRKHGIEARPIVAGNFCRNPVMRHLPHVELPPLPNADKLHTDGLFIGNHHYELGPEFETLEAALDDFVRS